jgi:nucleotide-binding universal stress UspA family protein
MVTIRHILCPLDLSDASPTIYRYATALAIRYRASLTVLELLWVGFPVGQPAGQAPVLTPAELEEYDAELDRFVGEHTPRDLEVRKVLRETPIVSGILQEAKAGPADLIVIGTHGRGGFARLVLGSVAEKVIRLAPCPVLIVPTRARGAAAEGAPFKTIVCALDFSPASLVGLRHALSLAQESGSRLCLVHVLDWPTDRPVPPGLGPELASVRRSTEDAARLELKAAVTEEARQWCDCREEVAVGRPYEEILRIASERDADLIVLGMHGRTIVERALFGSTATQVVRRSSCPVLTVHP